MYDSCTRDSLLEYDAADGWRVVRWPRVVLVTPGVLASEYGAFASSKSGALDRGALRRALSNREHSGRGAFFSERAAWLCTVVDEAHVLRNEKTRNSRAVAALPTRLWLMLTGTPFGKLCGVVTLINACSESSLGCGDTSSSVQRRSVRQGVV